MSLAPRLRHLALAALLALGVAYAWLGLTGLAGPNYDDQCYLALGRSLAEGHGYRHMGLVGTPFERSWPPGYPAILALVWLVFPAWPANLLAFKAINIVMTLLAALGMARLVRVHGASELEAVAVGVLSFGSGAMIALMDLTMSEPTYTAAVVGVLNLAEGRLDRRRLVWLGLACAGVLYVKAIGITLVAAAGLWLLCSRGWGPAIGFGLVLTAAYGPWQLWIHWAGSGDAHAGGTYFDWLRDNMPLSAIGDDLRRNTPRALGFSFPLMLAGLSQNEWLARLGPWVRWAGEAAFFVALGGLVGSARERLRLWHCYAAVFVVFVLGFNWEPTRYLATATPLLAYGLVLGCRWLAGHGRLPGKVLAGLLLALALGAAPWRLASMLAHHASHDALLPPQTLAELHDRQAFTAWAGTGLPADAVLVGYRPDLMNLDTGRKAAYYTGLDAWTRALFAEHPCYLVYQLGPHDFYEDFTALRRRLGPARPLYQAPAGQLEVYRIPARL